MGNPVVSYITGWWRDCSNICKESVYALALPIFPAAAAAAAEAAVPFFFFVFNKSYPPRRLVLNFKHVRPFGGGEGARALGYAGALFAV